MRRFMSGAAGWVVLTMAVTAQAYEWQSYNGHQYALTQDNLTWAAAENEAVSAGAHLVTINDAAENDWLVQTFGNIPAPIAWIGYYQGANSQWSWISGEPVTYTNYFWEFPQGGIHAYIHLRVNLPGGVTQPGEWNANPLQDNPETPLYCPPGIIEVVPEPVTSSLLMLGGLAILRRR